MAILLRIGDSVKRRVGHKKLSAMTGTVVKVKRNRFRDSANSFYRVKVLWANGHTASHSGAQISLAS